MMDGIAGIYAPGDSELVKNLVLATGACQHRGKACAGIAIGNGRGIYIHKGLGRIGDVITPDVIKAYQDLEPVAAIGNVGYTKHKYPEKINTEPIRIYPKTNSKLELVLTLDGYILEEERLKTELEQDYNFETRNKTEVVGALLHKYITKHGITFEAGKKLIDKLHRIATFALTALVYDGKDTYMIVLNSDEGFEPSCYGIIDGAFVHASESCSQRRLGGFIEEENLGAEMTICSLSKGPETRRVKKIIQLPDIFQGVYFGNAASIFQGKGIFQIRRELGWELVDKYGPFDGTKFIYNPDSGLGVTMGIFEATISKLEEMALDYSKLDDGIILVKDREVFERHRALKTIYPGLVKQAQAVRTFLEGEKSKRYMEVGLKFIAIDSIIKDEIVDEGDDSIVKGSVGEGGAVWAIKNAGPVRHNRNISYGPMFFPSFKEWYRGRECLEELAVQRAFKGDNPYDKSLDEIDKAVAKLTGVNKVRYNTKEHIEKVTGPGSFQALDASYPIDEKFWPDWLKIEVEKFHKYRPH